MNERRHIVEKDWDYKGYRCVVIVYTTIGHRCGYVGVPQDHFLYEVGYSKPCRELGVIRDIYDKQVGKRGIISCLAVAVKNEYDAISPDLYFDVHGSLTYAGGGKKSNYPVESDLWWFGYDCGHCDDARIPKYDTIGFPAVPGAIVRSLEYCIGECESLAEQLKEAQDKQKGAS